MAKKKTDELDEPVGEQLAIEEKRYALKTGSITIPEVVDGKGEWVTYRNDQFTPEVQDKVLAYWRKIAEGEPKFNVEAKIAKLLVEVK